MLLLKQIIISDFHELLKDPRFFFNFEVKNLKGLILIWYFHFDSSFFLLFKKLLSWLFLNSLELLCIVVLFYETVCFLENFLAEVEMVKDSLSDLFVYSFLCFLQLLGFYSELIHPIFLQSPPPLFS